MRNSGTRASPEKSAESSLIASIEQLDMPNTVIDHASGPPVSTNDLYSIAGFPTEDVEVWLAAIIHSVLDGIIVIDATCRVVLLNRQIEQLLGLRADDLLGKALDSWTPHQVRQLHGSPTERLTISRSGRMPSRYPLHMRHGNGEEFVVEARVSRATVKSTQFIALVVPEKTFAAKPMRVNERRKQVQLNAPLDRRKRAVSTEQANEREKKRVSKELYDDLGQRLSVLKLDLDWLEHSHADHHQELPARVAQMQALLDQVISQTKNIASTLRPPLLDDFGLMPALKWITAAFQKRTSVSCTIESGGMAIKHGDPIDSAIYRIVQESLLNIERHANANNVKIVIQRKDNALNLVIQDDGVGMARGSENKAGCFGLIAMQERVDILGGSMRIKKVMPQGVAIHAIIPIEPTVPALLQ